VRFVHCGSFSFLFIFLFRPVSPRICCAVHGERLRERRKRKISPIHFRRLGTRTHFIPAASAAHIPGSASATVACYRRPSFQFSPIMPLTLPLKKMTRDEKLRTMEAIWSDLSQDEAKVKSPAWHADALQHAERSVKAGKAKFSDWDEAKQRIRRKALVGA
jgi:hypothetical protein